MLQYKFTKNNNFTEIKQFFRKPLVKRLIFALIVISSFILIYIFNIKHLLFGDDWMYSMAAGGREHLHSFSDIIKVQYNHYFEWGGRTVVHIIAQSLLLSGTETGDLINSIAFVIFALVIYILSNNTKILRPALLLIIFLYIWFLQPAFGSTILWITGSANYLWGTLIILTFLIPYVRNSFTLKTTNNMLYTGIMFFFGIISGWTNENMAVALVFMLIGFLVYYKKQIGKIPTWAIAGLIGATIGAIFMIAAPGNYVRMENVVSNNYTGQPTIYVLFSRILGAVAAYYYYVLIPTFIFFILLWLYLAFGNKQSKKNAVLFLAFLFFSGAIVATSAMSASPIFPGRAAFGIISLILVACGILYSNLDFSNKLLNRLSFTSVIFALLLFTADYYRGYKALDMVQRHMQNRVEIIESGKKNGQTDFVFEDRMTPPDSRFTHFFELTPDSTDWHNGIYSAYYGIHSIIVK